ncbi:MAG TPA: tetratricopeptide repeat protein [Candidatus Polarisedimenticolaceae bacterium]|nr:tetratricopeptide repeat protein [Candidatus Polarisedimenticolaceae bacterium]
MPILSAETQFKKGLAALVDHNYKDASVFFRRAIEADSARSGKKPDLRYLSYYGLSLSKSGGSTTEAIRLCRAAVAKHRNHPVLLLNLGRVYLEAGKHSHALDAFDRALRLAPDNQTLVRELKKLDRRAAPVLGMLPRSHPLNVALGKLRHNWRRSRSKEAAQPVSVPRS